MSSTVFDFKELDDFAKTLLEQGQRGQPKRIKKFLNKEGYALRKVVRETSKSKVHRRTGRYHKEWRKGKVYAWRGDKNNLAVRVYNATPGAGAIEVGRTYTKDGREWFKPGAHVLDAAVADFKPQYASHLDDLLDDLAESIES